jgi:lambda family phage portal protein
MGAIANMRHIGARVAEAYREARSTVPSKISAEQRERELYQRAMTHAKALYYSGRYAPGADQSRLRNDWLTSVKSMTSLLSAEWKTLVARSEFATRTNAYAKSARTVIIDHVVGSGLRPFAAVRLMNGKRLDSVNKILERDWERFNDQGVRDGNSHKTFYDSQRLAIGTIFDEGAVLTNTVPSRPDSWLPYAFQILKPTRLDFTKDTWTTTGNSYGEHVDIASPTVIHGMNLNQYGECTGFNLVNEAAQRSPNEMAIHYYQQEAEQYLGLPWLTPVLPFTWDLGQILEDRLVASRIIERLALWVKKTSKKTMMQTADEDDGTIPWERGSILSTQDKPEVIQAQSNFSDTFGALVRLYLHGIGAGLGFSFILLTRDLDGVNFASSRFNKIADNRFFQSLYRWFAKGYCQSVWDKFVEWEFLSGKIPGFTYSQYKADPWYYNQCYWLPEGEEWVDPLSDAKALDVAYKNGWMTLQEVCASQGKDWKSVLNQRATEKQLMTDLGLTELLPVDQLALAEAKAKASSGGSQAGDTPDETADDTAPAEDGEPAKTKSDGGKQ